MNIFFRELKAHRKSLIFWCLGVIFMIVSGMGKYGAMSGSGQSINELMEGLPKGLQSFFGVGGLDLSTVIGYYGLLYLYVAIMAAVHAVMLGATIIAKEERDKTAEFLFSKPISRRIVVSSKLLAALVQAAIINITAYVSSVLIVSRYDAGPNVSGNIATLMMGMFLLQLVFLAIGAAVGALQKKAEKAGATASAIMVATFILSVVIDMNEKMDPLKYLTPFKYFEAKELLFGGGFNGVFLLLSGAIIAVMVAATFINYQGRDLN
ncbi:ABC transporter [Neobacillus notoginsengisoli]|uniref:ABC transporter n=1 Tax=Neobacillus notoginsengisoli TaxID=1578198 RepID=A0A417Z097_9BACI|nr:ABC transporter permease subunit [Neobacillus notoginsengisoli]RHW43557.1 ABC transporter [Neobacillus notoginsengisoli]